MQAPLDTMELARPPAEAPARAAIYVYAFGDAVQLSRLRRAPGIEAPISVHRVGGVGAVYREVDPAEFSGSEAERNLADPTWVMRWIGEHEAVVEKAMQLSPVFPAGFPTLYLGLNSLTAFVRRHEMAIATFLGEVAGHQEWALKITAELDDHATLEALALDLWPKWEAYSTGVRYLRVRQQRPVLLGAARDRASQLIAGIVDEVRPLVTSIRPLPVTASPQGIQYVESHALLVAMGDPVDLRERLATLAGESRSPRLDITLTGPWPPYSFRPRLNGGIRPEDD